MTEDGNVRVSSSDEASVSNDASQSRQRKKRRWDQPAESLVSAGIAVPGVLPLPNTASLCGIAFSGVTPISSTLLTNPLANSCSVMSQISVQQNTASAVQKLTQQKLQDELLIAREIVINDAESSVRYKLTKRQTQEEIQRCTGAVVITRGKYRPPNAPPDGEKPLYLHISAGAHIKETAERILAVDRAAAMVEEMLRQGPNTQPISSTLNPTMANGVKVNQLLSTCVFLDFDADPSLNIVARIRGPNDQYINHIMNETGATVTLQGRGSGNNEEQDAEDGNQPLHLFLSSNNAKSLEDAKLLAENLLHTISVECGASRVSSCKVYSAVPPPQQVYDGSPLSHPIASAIPPLQQVYSAVPPPQQLLAGGPGAGTDLMASTSVTNSLMSSSTVPSTPVPPASFVGVPGATHPLVPGTTPQSLGFLSSSQPQANMVGYAPPLASGATSYIGYGGIYPQATPLQQVALALRQSPSIASTVVPAVSASNGESKSTTSSDLDKEKRPPQKRKFQELPASLKGSTKYNQGLEPKKPREQSDELVVRNVSTMPAPKKLIQPSSNGMRPSQPRSMPPPPPPPKFPAPAPAPVPVLSPSQVKVHDKYKVLSKTKSSDVPDTLVKLMEYGDEDDDDLDDSGEETVGQTTCVVAAQKPFWAL